jgi:large subunit ribosomal protein L5
MENWEKKILTKDLIYKKKLTNVFDLPILNKICLKMNNKKTIQNSQNVFFSFAVLEVLTNQKPKVCFAKKSIANFKVQKKMPLGCKITLRKYRKNSFLELFLFFVLPKIDFKIKQNEYNFNIGIKNLLFIPQLAIIHNFNLNDFGFNIAFNFSVKNFSLFLSGFQIKDKNEKA